MNVNSLPNYQDLLCSEGKIRQYETISYIKLEEIGKGKYKTCWRAQFGYDTRAVLKQNFQEKDVDELIHYLNVIQTLKGHPSIAVTEETFWTCGEAEGTYKFFQIQTCYTCDLVSAVNGGLFVDNPVLIQVAFRHLADGLAFIHERGVVVKDIKMDNIYLTHSLTQVQFVYGDFGGADLKDKQSSLNTVSAPYASPQRLRRELSVLADDVFSLGICFAAIQKGEVKFRFPIDFAKTANLPIDDAIEKFIKKTVFPQFRPLISPMLSVQRLDRPTAIELKKNVRGVKLHKRTNSI